MIPKDKAKELVDKYKGLNNVVMRMMKETVIHSVTKQCALICVDEILLELEDVEDSNMDDRIDYWYDVKEEIIKI